ncbi:helix-turn-helix domain-containing protein [Gordonia sp. PP30]|uniref:helix-turn-helix domain-containing protein n=1 Tax=Gordonia sp. PP30 TaxID=2935861 RepID=UPI001FFF19C5|nr:helix-turn-helix domain-containing protein [Gordonia sp. PP30]UQE74697.1 helix-turn-helix domain-containing protein [Gordonia sp. PP30]
MPKLSGAQHAALWAIFNRADGRTGAGAVVSAELLAERQGIHPDTARAALSSVRALGLVLRTKRGGRSNSGQTWGSEWTLADPVAVLAVAAERQGLQPGESARLSTDTINRADPPGRDDQPGESARLTDDVNRADRSYQPGRSVVSTGPIDPPNRSLSISPPGGGPEPSPSAAASGTTDAYASRETGNSGAAAAEEQPAAVDIDAVEGAPQPPAPFARWSELLTDEGRVIAGRFNADGLTPDSVGAVEVAYARMHADPSGSVLPPYDLSRDGFSALLADAYHRYLDSAPGDFVDVVMTLAEGA